MKHPLLQRRARASAGQPLAKGIDARTIVGVIVSSWVKHVRETPDEVVDQAVAPNVNAEWVNMKGTWKHKRVLVQDDNIGLC